MAALTLDYAKCCELAERSCMRWTMMTKRRSSRAAAQLRVTSPSECGRNSAQLATDAAEAANHKDNEIEQAAQTLLAQGSWHKAVVAWRFKKRHVKTTSWAAMVLDVAQCTELAGDITYAVDHDDKATLLEVLAQLRVTSPSESMDAIQHSGLGNELLKLVNHKDKEIEQAAQTLLAQGSRTRRVVAGKRKTTPTAAASSSNDVPKKVFLSFTFPSERIDRSHGVHMLAPHTRQWRCGE